jgi:hypothetical protein
MQRDIGRDGRNRQRGHRVVGGRRDGQSVAERTRAILLLWAGVVDVFVDEALLRQRTAEAQHAIRYVVRRRRSGEIEHGQTGARELEHPAVGVLGFGRPAVWCSNAASNSRSASDAGG